METKDGGITVIALGGTGLVGREFLARAAAHPGVRLVVAPVRAGSAMKLPEHPKIMPVAVDYEALDGSMPWWKADVAVCCLGTTRKKAGSAENFRRVDHDYPLAAARMAAAAGTPAFVCVSSKGADSASRNFYLRVKGETEEDLARVGFRSLVFVRPNVIAGHRDEFRLGEEIALSALTVLAPLLPPRLRASGSGNIARVLLELALQRPEGTGYVESDQLG